MGVIQPVGERGSLKWIQRLVDARPDLVDLQLRKALGFDDPVRWLSPLQTDAFREYRDQEALERLGVSMPVEPLSDFWPALGPQWDALARAGDALILVEAKAHINELFSTECQAKNPASRAKIREALDRASTALGAKPGLDWMLRFYQYANRLAHLHFLRDVNGLDAHLVLLCFLNDSERKGPRSKEEWRAALDTVHEAMGIRGRIPTGLHDVFVDVRELEAVEL